MNQKQLLAHVLFDTNEGVHHIIAAQHVLSGHGSLADT